MLATATRGKVSLLQRQRAAQREWRIQRQPLIMLPYYDSARVPMKNNPKVAAAMRLVALFALALTESALGETRIAKDRVTGEPIPSLFFLENELPLSDRDVSLQDADGDKFLNEDEWRHETNPQDKDSHPPFHTKLFLVARAGQTLRLKFTAFDGQPKEAGHNKTTFQINVWAGKWRTLFIQLGERDAETGLQIVSFQEAGTLTVKLAGEVMMLPLGREVEGPEGAARLRDDLGTGTEFVAKTGESFSLQGMPGVRYKLLRLSSAGATIELPDGKRYVAPPLPDGLKERKRAGTVRRVR